MGKRGRERWEVRLSLSSVGVKLDGALWPPACLYGTLPSPPFPLNPSFSGAENLKVNNSIPFEIFHLFYCDKLAGMHH